MNDIEQRLHMMMTRDADAVAHETDTALQWEELTGRLDAADRSRSRTRWSALALAAAAAVLVAVAGVALSQQSQEPTPPASPAPSASTGGVVFRSLAFAERLSLSLPSWVVPVATDPFEETEQQISFVRCTSDSSCVSFDVYAFDVDRTGAPATRERLVSSYESLAGQGLITLGDRTDVTVGGKQGTLLSVTPRRPVEQGLGCFSNGFCEPFLTGTTARYAVVDVDGRTVVIGMRGPTAAQETDGWLSELDTVLRTVRFGSEAQSPAARPGPSAISGSWRTTFTRQQVEDTLAEAGLGDWVDEALALLPRPQDTSWTYDLFIDGARLNLYYVTANGTPVGMDQHSYTLDGRVLRATSHAGGWTSQFDVARDGDRMTWTAVRLEGALRDGVPMEALERLLYTSSTWMRSTT